MTNPRPHAQLFDWAQAQAAALPMRLTIALRLAQLEVALAQRGVAPEDPRVAGLICALFPPGSIAAPSLPSRRAVVGTVKATGVRTPARHFADAGFWARSKAFAERFRYRTLLRTFAPLLLLFMASDAPPITIVPPANCLPDCLPPPSASKIGHWENFDVTVEKTNWAYYKRAAGLVVLGLAIWLLLYLRRQRLIRESNPDLATVIALSVRLGRSRLFDAPSFEAALRAFKLRHRTPSDQIDISGTLRATVSQAGFPVIVLGERRIPPGYLVLSERQSSDDHLPEIGKAFHARLCEAQIAARHYEYFGTPYRLGTIQAGVGPVYQPLDAVMARHPGARALMVEESFDLHDDVEDRQLAATLGMYFTPVLLNPREPVHWELPERVLARAGIGRVYLGELSGETVAQALARPGAGGNKFAVADADLPAFLASDSDLLVAEDKPESLDVEALIINLSSHWLSPAEMAWLRTIALFPAVHVGFSYYSGIVLSGRAALDMESTLRLFRLPWLRAGRIPSWLRAALIHGLTPEEFARAKAIVVGFFAPESARARTARELITICDRSHGFRQRRRFARQLAGSQLPALRDGLLQDAFTRRDPLEVKIGTPRQHKRRWWLRAEVMAAIIALGLGLQYLLDSRTLDETRTDCCKWIEDVEIPIPPPPPEPEPAPSNPGPTPLVHELSAADRTLYVQFANPLDKEPALTIIDELTLIRFSDGPIIIPGMEYRSNSPSRTQVRCFTNVACKNAPAIVNTLAANGITATVSDSRKGRYAGSRPLELWLADKDLVDFEDTPVKQTEMPEPGSIPNVGDKPVWEGKAQITKLDEQSDKFYDAKNYSRAFDLNSKACDLGGTRGCFWNGYLYESGKGVTRNIEMAITWYQRACDLRLEQACTKVFELQTTADAR